MSIAQFILIIDNQFKQILKGPGLENFPEDFFVGQMPVKQEFC